MTKWYCLAGGSLTGGLSRYVFAALIQSFVGPGFPYGTLAVNLSGCFLIGLFNVAAHERLGLGPESRLLLMAGFCGAYTTFSTMILETSDLLKAGRLAPAAAYLGASLALGLAVFWAGEQLGGLV